MLCVGWCDYTYKRVGDLTLGVMHRTRDAVANPDPQMRYLLWIKSPQTQQAMLAAAVKRRILHRTSQNLADQTYLIELDRLTDITVLLEQGEVLRVDECIRDRSAPTLVDYFWTEHLARKPAEIRPPEVSMPLRRSSWHGTKPQPTASHDATTMTESSPVAAEQAAG